MGAILAAILPVLAKIPGYLGEYFKRKDELRRLDLENELEIKKEERKLASELARARLERQKEALRATGRRFKYFTFVMWFGPYMAQIVWPGLGAAIFENLSGMPEWYAQSCVAIMFTVWGISVSAPVIGNIFKGLGQFFREKRIAKAAISPNVDNEALFEIIRSLTPHGKLSQKQVDKINEVL